MTLSEVVGIAQIIIWIFVIAYYVLVYKNKIDQIEKSVKSIDQVKKYVNDLSEYLKAWEGVPKHLRHFESYYAATSPLQLTESGKAFIRDSGFEPVYEENKEYFVATLREELKGKEEDKSFFYFCEEYAIDLIRELENDESHLLADVREFIFKRGLSDRKKVLFKTLGIFLRDKIINEFGKKDEFEKLIEEEKGKKDEVKK